MAREKSREAELASRWLKGKFRRDRDSGVFLARKGVPELEYSDGDDVENRLFAVIEGASDCGVGSQELESGVRDFPSRYHLTSRRANLLRPVQNVLRERVVEVGAGCGALTRFLGEGGAEVWAVEGSARRARICSARCKDLGKVKVFCSNIEGFTPPVRFDAVVLVGVLEYSPMFLGVNGGVGGMLELCRGLLTDDGVLIVAIENQLGLKYFAGAPEDHLGIPFLGINDGYTSGGTVTFGRIELEREMRMRGFAACEFLYPFPDYKFPRVVLHPAACREPRLNLGSIIRTCVAEDQSIPYERVFAEEMAWPVLARNELLEHVANSFLVVASKKKPTVPRVNANQLVYAYSEARRRCYAKETILSRTGEQIFARNQRLYVDPPPTGAAFSQLLQDEELTPGRLWIDGLFPLLNQRGWTHKEVAEWARPWVEFLRQSEVKKEGGEVLLPPNFVDCTPFNLIEQPDGKLHAFDLEWVAQKPVSLKFVVFRGLVLGLMRARTVAEPGRLAGHSMIELCQAIMALLGINVTPHEMEGLINEEAELQELVAGIGDSVRKNYLLAKLPSVRVAEVRQAFSAHESLRLLRDAEQQFGEALAAAQQEIAKRDETKDHIIREREKAIEWLRTELSQKQTALEAGQAELAVRDGAIAEHEKAIEWLRTELSQKQTALEAGQAELAVRNGAIAEHEKAIEWLRTELSQKQTALEAGQAELAVRDGAIAEREKAIEWLRTELSQKQTALEAGQAELAVRNGAIAEREKAIEWLRTELSQKQTALEARLEELETARRQGAEQRASLEAELRSREQQLQAVYSGAEHFDSVLEETLSTYRSQRAWQVMLAIRKAYALAVRGGWRGKRRFLRWVAGLLRQRYELDEQELAFPRLQNHLPPWGEMNKLAQEPVAAELTLHLPDQRTVMLLPTQQPPQRNYDLIVFAIIDFDFRYQRPQQIAAEFARQGHRVFWISPTRFLPAGSTSAYHLVPLRENLWEIHLRGQQPDVYLGELSEPVAEQLASSLGEFYRDWAVAENCALVQLPFWRRLALKFREEHGARVLYDCMDEWDTFENMGRFNVEEERKLVRECDVLAVTAQKLVEKFAKHALRPVLVRNAADFEFFQRAEPRGLPGHLGGPIVGYFGAIADWIDLDLVYRVARSRPKYSFVLIGQVFGRDTSSLESLPNVHLLGNRPYEDIPGFLHCFDVCQIPFLLNQVTQATDPVKLYEYFSLGKPVVATNMAELRQCSDLVYIARDAEEFARKLDAALGETDESLKGRRIEFARENTWTHRVRTLDESVAKSYPLVSIIVVTYNSSEFVSPCLNSIGRNTSYPSYEVIVVDNGSRDGTVEILKGHASGDSRIRLECLPSNTGFASGNNAGARAASGDYLVFLNADTIVTPGWVERLLRHVKRDPSIGLICAVTNFAGNEVKINVDYRNEAEMELFALRVARQGYGRVLDISMAPLFCAMISRSLFKEVGGLDEGYQIGMFEDDDLSICVRQRALRVAAAEDCFIHHFGQGSFAKLPGEEYNRLFEENRRRFEEKWQTAWIAHKTRPNVKPPFEEARFTPAEFCNQQMRTEV